jgi:hypothetical protein
MASFANISDIITAGIQSRTGALADNVTQNTALLNRLKKRGNVKTFSGGNVILQEIAYLDATTRNAGSYSGYDVIDITPNSPISAAQFDLKQYAAAVSVSGLEMLQNSGKERIIDLVEGRIMVAEANIQDRVSAGIYSNGTGNGGKDITGLAAAVATAPTSGTYGGINRATWSFWQNKSFGAVTNGGSAATSANIQSYMNRLAMQLVRGTDSADLIVADNNYYRLYLESLQAIQRVQSEEMAGAGFSALKYFGTGKSADVVLDGGIGGSMTTNQMYFLNTKYIFFRPHADRNFVPIGADRMSVNQDAVTKLIAWAGNLTSSGAQFQGVLHAG